MLSNISKTKRLVLAGAMVVIIVLLTAALYYYNNSPYVKVKKAIRQAQTVEKKAALEAIYERMSVYGHHITPAETCAYLVLSAHRNEDVIKTITTEYVLQPYGGTLNYVTLAQLAAEAPVADKEFLEIAELVKNNDYQKALIIAEKAAKAETKEEIVKIQHEIDDMK